ncbi:MAG: hypothetical protein CL555_02910 [Algoriphagus sp.]|nr:hypothetical protein [Algoriphagus sp.]
MFLKGHNLSRKSGWNPCLRQAGRVFSPKNRGIPAFIGPSMLDFISLKLFFDSLIFSNQNLKFNLG